MSYQSINYTIRSRKAVREPITNVFLLQIQQVKLAWNAKSKVGSLENATHKPGGGDKKIETVKLDFKEKAKPKIGSKDNVKYQPGGGAVKVCIHKPLADWELGVGNCAKHFLLL
jgi:hypothetical protein